MFHKIKLIIKKMDRKTVDVVYTTNGKCCCRDQLIISGPLTLSSIYHYLAKLTDKISMSTDNDITMVHIGQKLIKIDKSIDFDTDLLSL